jgi:hypothetical protein
MTPDPPTEGECTDTTTESPEPLESTEFPDPLSEERVPYIHAARTGEEVVRQRIYALASNAPDGTAEEDLIAQAEVACEWARETLVQMALLDAVCAGEATLRVDEEGELLFYEADPTVREYAEGLDREHQEVAA